MLEISPDRQSFPEYPSKSHRRTRKAKNFLEIFREQRKTDIGNMIIFIASLKGYAALSNWIFIMRNETCDMIKLGSHPSLHRVLKSLDHMVF